MSTEKLELNVLIEKIRSNDTSLGNVLNWHHLLRDPGMISCFTLDGDWSRFGLVGCRVSDDGFVQFIEALKVNTTLGEIYLGGTFKLFYGCRYHSLLFRVVVCLGMELGNDGAKYIADVLKVSTTLKSILLFGEVFFVIFCIFFFFGIFWN